MSHERRRHFIGRVFVLMGAMMASHIATAQPAVLLNEDFESDTPGAFPAPPSPDTLILHTGGPAGQRLVVAQDGVVVGGKAFDDPIGGAGNKSLAFDNNPGGTSNTAPTNITVAWHNSPWPGEASDFTWGFIEYDVFLDPVPAGGSSRTYLEHRIGFTTDNDPNTPPPLPAQFSDGNFYPNGGVFISTLGDVLTRYAFVGENSGPGGAQAFTLRNEEQPGFTTAATPLIGATNDVRVDILPDRTYSLTLNGVPVVWAGPGGPTTTLPWATASGQGVDIMTFVTDSSPDIPHGLVWLDNVRVESIPEPAGFTLVALGAICLAARRRCGATDRVAAFLPRRLFN